MSFHPTINSIQEWNQILAESCHECCEMPGCLTPIAQNQFKARQPCTFVRIIDNCWKHYRTRTRTQTVSDSSSTVIAGVTVASQSRNWTKQTVSTIEPGPEASCVFTDVCSASGTESYKTWFYQTGTSNGQVVVTAGPFPATFTDWTLSLGDGLPDPTWTPGPGQTEANRPLMPPCTLIWTVVQQTYTAQFNAQNVLTGSTLTNTTTTYQKTDQAVAVPVFSNELDCADIRESFIDPEFDEEDFIGEGLPTSSFNCDACSPLSLSTATWGRYRWVINPCHTGAYYRIDWDEIFFPDEFTEWYDNARFSAEGNGPFDPNANPPPVLPTITPKSWVWTGVPLLEPICDELTPEEYEARLNDETRMSPWATLFPPATKGVVEIRNVRAVCYQNPYGNVPYSFDEFGLFNPADLDGDDILDVNEPLPPPEP